MKLRTSINESIHHIEELQKGENFLKAGAACTKIGMLENGVMRGFVQGIDGNEITTHFYQEGDMIIGSYMPQMKVSMTIEALIDCQVSVADYEEVMSWVNKDMELTKVVTQQFQKENNRSQSRLVSLLNLDSLEKYKAFLEEYPGLINRIPHYYIAQYLGITPTQLSRARKQFLNNC